MASSANLEVFSNAGLAIPIGIALIELGHP